MPTFNADLPAVRWLAAGIAERSEMHCPQQGSRLHKKHHDAADKDEARIHRGRKLRCSADIHQLPRRYATASDHDERAGWGAAFFVPHCNIAHDG